MFHLQLVFIFPPQLNPLLLTTAVVLCHRNEKVLRYLTLEHFGDFRNHKIFSTIPFWWVRSVFGSSVSHGYSINSLSTVFSNQCWRFFHARPQYTTINNENSLNRDRPPVNDTDLKHDVVIICHPAHFFLWWGRQIFKWFSTQSDANRLTRDYTVFERPDKIFWIVGWRNRVELTYFVLSLRFFLLYI